MYRGSRGGCKDVPETICFPELLVDPASIHRLVHFNVVNGEIVLLGKHYEGVLVELVDGRWFRLIPVRERRFVKVSNVIGKPCATKDDLLEIAKKLLGEKSG